MQEPAHSGYGAPAGGCGAASARRSGDQGRQGLGCARLRYGKEPRCPPGLHLLASPGRPISEGVRRCFGPCGSPARRHYGAGVL